MEGAYDPYPRPIIPSLGMGVKFEIVKQRLGHDGCSLQLEHPALHVHPATKPGEASITAQHPVTWYYDGPGIAGHGLAHSAGGARRACQARDLSLGPRLSAGDVAG